MVSNMAKKAKKVDVKAVEKAKIMAIVNEALVAAGIEVADGTEYGMTSHTLIAKGEVCDVQLKPITPKAGSRKISSGRS